MTTNAIDSDVVTYLYHMDRVEGWLDETTGHVIRELLEFQNVTGTHGHIMEIGVHHGKLFILASILTKSDEKSVAVDLFDMQELNIDSSGLGNLDQFMFHFKSFADGRDLQIEKGDSVSLATYLKDKYANSVRYISVDGGHTREIACNDLWIAETVLTKNGICSLDDIYSIGWSGVTAGLGRYFAQGGTMVPFAISPAKVHLAKNALLAQHYRGQLMSVFNQMKTTQFFEFDNVLVIPSSGEFAFDQWAKQNVSDFDEHKVRWILNQWTARWYSEKGFFTGNFLDRHLELEAEPGQFCLWGPYTSVKPGRYMFRANLCEPLSGGLFVDVVDISANTILGEQMFRPSDLVQIEFDVVERLEKVEFRIRGESNAKINVESVVLEKV